MAADEGVFENGINGDLGPGMIIVQSEKKERINVSHAVRGKKL